MKKYQAPPDIVLIHLGIASSLALGRWIRDLPRKGSDEGLGEGASETPEGAL